MNNTQEDVTEKESNDDNTQEKDEGEDQEEYGEPCDPKREVKKKMTMNTENRPWLKKNPSSLFLKRTQCRLR